MEVGSEEQNESSLSNEEEVFLADAGFEVDTKSDNYADVITPIKPEGSESDETSSEEKKDEADPTEAKKEGEEKRVERLEAGCEFGCIASRYLGIERRRE